MSHYTLYGSTTSPYVRRLRILMQGLDVEFKVVKIFDEQDRAFVKQKSPVLKIPFLEIHEGQRSEVLYDSRIISNYILAKYFKESRSLHEENLLTIIDGINDSLVTLYMMKSSGFDTESDVPFIRAQKERIREGFNVLNSSWAHDHRWDYLAISLYTLLDWIHFRSLWPMQEWTNLESFRNKHQERSDVQATDPRLS